MPFLGKNGSMNILLTCMVVIFLAACGTSKPDPLLDQIKALVVQAKDSGKHVHLNQVDAIDWNALFLINPYTSIQSLGSEFAADSRIKKTRIDQRDDITVLVFTKDNQIVDVIEFPRKIFDFSELQRTRFTPMGRFQVDIDSPLVPPSAI